MMMARAQRHSAGLARRKSRRRFMVRVVGAVGASRVARPSPRSPLTVRRRCSCGRHSKTHHRWGIRRPPRSPT
jgi:hypothetical protein